MRQIALLNMLPFCVPILNAESIRGNIGSVCPDSQLTSNLTSSVDEILEHVVLRKCCIHLLSVDFPDEH